MNRIKTVLTLAAVLAGAAASTPAFAWGHARFSFGVVIGAPFYPWYYPYYPPYYYAPPVVAVPSAPTTYIEQASPAPARASYWYYCEASRTYYPYVKDCPGGWMRVVPNATPPTPSAAPRSAPQTAPRATPPAPPQQTARQG